MNPTPQRNDEYDEIHGIASPNPEHLCIQFCQIHNSPANSTPQSGWEEKLLILASDISGREPTEDKSVLIDFVKSLLKEERTATEHEKSMTDITFAFEAGEKSGRTATLREVREDVQRLIRTSNQEHTHSSVDCEACAMQKAYGNVYNEIQHKLTSEL